MAKTKPFLFSLGLAHLDSFLMNQLQFNKVPQWYEVQVSPA
jgi:hypothetical protein